MANFGHILDSNTALLYRLEEGAGTTAIDETATLNLTYVGAPPQFSGLVGKARLFTGTGTRAAATAPVGLRNLFTGSGHGASIEAWIYPNLTGDAFQEIFNIGNGPGGSGVQADNVLLDLYLHTSGKIGTFHESGAGVSRCALETATGLLTADTWTHVAMTRQFTGSATCAVTLYVNGVQRAQQTFTSTALPDGGTNDSAWMATLTAAFNRYKGRIDEIRVSKVCRTGAEVLESYNRGIGYYSLADPPTNVFATTDNAQSLVTWSPPANDGHYPITGYTVTTSPGGGSTSVGAGVTSLLVTGLTNGTSYRFTITATTAAGVGLPATSNSVVPSALVALSAAYARQLKHLLPPGAVWLLEASSWISRTLLAASDELARIEQRGLDLIEESDPRTATETLPDWERVLGLPDSCVVTIPGTAAARRLAITQKLVRQGGQHSGFYVALAAACGYTVAVVEGFGSSIFRAGSRCGARVYGTAWAHVWQIDIDPPSGAALTHAELECIITRASPAHTVVLFNYL
jgi:uncharacterized protein YmfQ (DUF2313 family)